MSPRNRILVRESVLAARGFNGLNDSLDKAGLGRPLRPARSRDALVPLPLDDRDLGPALAALASHAGPDDLMLDGCYDAGTIGERIDGVYTLLGKKTGHAGASWEEVDENEMGGDPPEWRSVARRPVVALLDTAVYPCHWLTREVDWSEFLVESYWDGSVPIGQWPLADDGGPDFGSHLGHGSFIAGLIRKNAPDAQVLSLRVMGDDGLVSETRVAGALEWLKDRVCGGETVDVVLMAFGRPESEDNGSGTSQQVTEAIDALVHEHVRVVASAGNAASCARVFPACHATVAGPGMVSVGSGTERHPNNYSSFGDWVTCWHDGSDLVSVMPLVSGTTGALGGGFAKWSGTSFAAALVAAQFANSISTAG